MSNLFILNTGAETAGLQIAGGLEGADLNIVNAGPKGTFNKVGRTVGLSVDPKLTSTAHTAASVDLKLDGQFVVEINGVVMPHIFAANSLSEYFGEGGTGAEHNIRFLETINVIVPSEPELS